MASAFDLMSTDTLSGSDQIRIGVAANRDTRRAAIAVLQAYMQANLTFAGGAASQQYAAPSTTGFNVVVLLADTWMILTPTGTLAAGTITLPAVRDGQQWVQVSTTQAVTALTVGGAGASVSGAPTTLAAGGFFTLAYDETTNTWYRVA